MFISFQQYCQSRRPMLYNALDERISALTGQIPAKEYCYLRLALNGGKKLRGLLLGMIAEVLGGKWESALPRAVAVELIQAASLIHDDFVDQDRIRRHLPAVWTLEGARRAVLLGDVIFASAIHMMNEIGRDDGRVVSRAIAEISKGALMEPDDPMHLMARLRDGHWNRDLYEKIIHLKTGVLFEAACEMGAIAAEADNGIRLRCARYGALIGEAYQIADDMKDIRKYLLEGSIQPHEMAPLVPSFLCFANEARLHIEPLLTGVSSLISPPFRECLESTLECMDREIRHRLNLAADEIREVLEEKPHAALGFKAPADLVEMFNIS